MSDRAPSDCLLRSWMLRNIHEQKTKGAKETNNNIINKTKLLHRYYEGSMEILLTEKSENRNKII